MRTFYLSPPAALLNYRPARSILPRGSPCTSPLLQPDLPYRAKLVEVDSGQTCALQEVAPPLASYNSCNVPLAPLLPLIGLLFLATTSLAMITLLAAIVSLLLALLLCYAYPCRRRALPYPPGPPGHLIIGSKSLV